MIRASQPKGDSLWTAMSLVDCYQDVLLDIMRYKQSNVVEVVIKNKTVTHRKSYPLPNDVDLNDFHIYSIEWNKTHIIWKFDSNETHSMATNGLFTNEP